MGEYQPKVGDKVWVVPLKDPETGKVVGYLFKKRDSYNSPTETNHEVKE